MIFKAISHGRTSDAVIDQIECLILEGVLRSGDRLPAERDLATKLDVSRPVLRAALKDLEERNLIRTRHGGGTFVADVVGTIFSDEIFDLIRRHTKAQRDYFEFRRDIEGVIAEHAALRATETDRQILTRIVETMRLHHKEDDIKGEADMDPEFHQAIVEASHNMLMLHTMRSCFKLLSQGMIYSRIRLYEWPGVRQMLLGQHEDIYSAIVEGKSEDARAAVRAHIDYVEETLIQTNQARSWEEVAQMRMVRMSSAGKQGRGQIDNAKPEEEKRSKRAPEESHADTIRSPVMIGEKLESEASDKPFTSEEK